MYLLHYMAATVSLLDVVYHTDNAKLHNLEP